MKKFVFCKEKSSGKRRFLHEIKPKAKVMPGFAKKDAYLRRRLCLCSIPFMPNFSGKDKHEFSGLSSLFYKIQGKA